MSITAQDIKSLTIEHRVVWKDPDAQHEVEMGLWTNGGESLRTDGGHVVRWMGGAVPAFVLGRIVRIIPPALVPPALVPRRGLVIGKPGSFGRLLVCVKDRNWIGYAPELRKDEHWFSDAEARNLIKNHGWEVVDDLTKEGPR